MKTYVLWSGGYDSTLALARECKDSSENNPIVVITIEHHNLFGIQYKAEKQARKRILKILKKKYYIEELEINIDASQPSRAYSGWSQQVWWMTFSLPYIEDGSEIVFGYCLGDEFWKFRREHDQIIKYVSYIMGKKITIKYPLEFDNKETVLTELDNLKLVDYCWTCDSPIRVGRGFKSCGKCHKCKELKIMMEIMKEDNKDMGKEEKVKE